MMGTLFAQKQFRKLVIFHTGRTASGPSAYCGSLLAAELACAHGLTIDVQESCRPTEAATDRDVGTFLGLKVAPAAALIYPLKEEIVPWSLCGPCESSPS